jgi:phosphoribosyl 1,2-cyclic phosphodiesterase
LGPRGHLSNSQAADLVRKFATAKLKKLYLAHLSEECNAPHIAEREMRFALDERKLGVELIIL